MLRTGKTPGKSGKAERRIVRMQEAMRKEQQQAAAAPPAAASSVASKSIAKAPSSASKVRVKVSFGPKTLEPSTGAKSSSSTSATTSSGDSEESSSGQNKRASLMGSDVTFSPASTLVEGGPNSNTKPGSILLSSSSKDEELSPYLNVSGGNLSGNDPSLSLLLPGSTDKHGGQQGESSPLLHKRDTEGQPRPSSRARGALILSGSISF